MLTGQTSFGVDDLFGDFYYSHSDIIFSFGKEDIGEYSIAVTNETSDGRILPALYVTISQGDKEVWSGYVSDFLKQLGLEAGSKCLPNRDKPKC